MLQNTPKFRTKIANDASEFRAAQELRYRVFIQELGGGGDMVDHELGLERDRFDPYFCLLYTSPSPRDMRRSRMPSSA